MRKSKIDLTVNLNKKMAVAATVIAVLSIAGSGCGNQTSLPDGQNGGGDLEQTIGDAAGDSSVEADEANAEDSADAAADTKDIAAIKAENPDAIARIVITGTDVDAVIVQNDKYDFDYYLSGGGEEVFIEYPNQTNFCDFNEIIYGIDNDVLLSYKDPDYFGSHREVKLYLEEGEATYEIVMARSWKKEDLLASYAFPSTSQCQTFVDEMYDTRSLSDNVAEEYKKVSYMDFLLTMVAAEPNDPNKQYMVIARLIKDKTGTINHSNDDSGLGGFTF